MAGANPDGMPPEERMPPMSGIQNLRDYGGYAAAGGRLVRATLYRSAEHADATEEDLTLLDGLELATVIDLRSEAERAARPCRRGAGFAGRVVFSPGYLHARPPHAAAATPADGQVAGERMARLYRIMPFHADLVPGLKLYFETIAATDGATLVHCAAGKDRTGLAVALLHASLGVHPDDIVADYLLTNSASTLERRIAAFTYSVRAHTGEAMSEETLAVALSVAPEYIEGALDEVAQRGGIDAYLRTVLEIDDETKDQLRSRLIRPGG